MVPAIQAIGAGIKKNLFQENPDHAML